jgi:poly-gamma-glutamate synthesis protein (capsule biosynthesis protein)
MNVDRPRAAALMLLALVVIGCAPAPASAPAPVPPAPSLSLAPPSPTAVPAPTAAAAPPPLIRLLFTGDINPSRCPAHFALAANDFTLPFREVADRLRAADLTIGSLDGSLSDLDAPTACGDLNNKNLIGPARMTEGLQFAGFDVITVATNHIKNCGTLGWTCDDRAFIDTLTNLRAADIQPVGGGADRASARAPVIVERGGVRFSFLAVSEVGSEMWAGEHTPGTAPLSPAAASAVLADIAAARRTADVVIVLPQWGEEYADAPSAQQVAWAGQMIEAGATLVMGNQAHVVQAVEAFDSGLVAYALGNFVFDQGPSLVRREGVVLEADFRGAQFVGWKLWPLRIHDLFQPRWLEGAAARAVLDRIARQSAALPGR